MFKLAELQQAFILEANSSLDRIIKELGEQQYGNVLKQLCAEMHALGGGALFVGCNELAQLCRSAAALLAQPLNTGATFNSNGASTNASNASAVELIVSNAGGEVGLRDLLVNFVTKLQQAVTNIADIAKYNDKENAELLSCKDALAKLSSAFAVVQSCSRPLAGIGPTGKVGQTIDGGANASGAYGAESSNNNFTAKTVANNRALVTNNSTVVANNPAVSNDSTIMDSILAKASSGGEMITEDEFYSLLDELSKAKEKFSSASPPVTASAVQEAMPLLGAQPVSPIVPAASQVVAPAQQQTMPQVHAQPGQSIREAQLEQQAVAQLSSQATAAKLPIIKLFTRISGLVSTLAKELGKRVILEAYGEDVAFPEAIVDSLMEPLIHFARNAVDHGIEFPEERLKAHKMASGIVRLRVALEPEAYIVSIEDDGQGIDLAAVKQSAIKNNVITPEDARTLLDAESVQLIFKPGVSSKAEVTTTSGRGVGMDAAMCKLQELKAEVKTESNTGKGTKFTIRIPVPSK